MSDQVADMPRRYPGLWSHRGKNGFVYWYTITSIGGRPPKGKRLYVRHGALSREEAEKRHKTLVDLEWRRTHDFAPPEVVESAPVEVIGYTFDEAAELWTLALEAAGRDPKTVRNYRFYLKWGSSFFGKKSLSAIGVEDAQRLRVSLKNGVDVNGTPISVRVSVRNGVNTDGKPILKPHAFRTRQNIERVISMLFRYGMDPSRRWVDQNPFASLVTEKAPKKRDKKGVAFRRLHPREDEALLQACGSDWQRCAVAIGLYLGVRVSPVSCLRLADIDLFNQVICVPCEINKGHSTDVREDQALPIPRHLMPFLRKQYEFAMNMKSLWLFPTGVVNGRQARAGHIVPENFRKRLVKAAAKIGYKEGVSFHALRAICNNRFRAAGIYSALQDAALGTRAVLGHSTEHSAKPYIDATVEYLRPVIARYDDWLDELGRATDKVIEMRDKAASTG